MKPDKEEFEEWKNSYMTKKFFEFLVKEAKLHREVMSTGGCVRPNPAETGLEYLRVNERAIVFELIPTVEFDDVFPEEEINESNSSRVQTPDSTG